MKVFEEYLHIKKKCWGDHFWGRGYFCVTAGELTKEMIVAYLEHHTLKGRNIRTLR